MGWIMAIFDLPVGTKRERSLATKFRKNLLDDGYVMLQFSVYIRPCVSFDHMEKHKSRLLSMTPDSGFVKILFFTDKQWALSINIIGNENYLDSREASLPMPEQILFW